MRLSFLKAFISLILPGVLCFWIFYSLNSAPGAEKIFWKDIFWAGQKVFWLGHLMGLLIAWRENYAVHLGIGYLNDYYKYQSAPRRVYIILRGLFDFLFFSVMSRSVWIVSTVIGYILCSLTNPRDGTYILPFIVFGVILDTLAAFFKMLSKWPEEKKPLPARAGAPVQQELKVPAGAEFYRLNKDSCAYSKIIGLEEPKRRMQEAIEMMLNTETGQKMKEYGLKPPKGIILYGPPGTGKTSFARATARIFGLPFIVVNASSVTGNLVGATEQNIRNVFRFARSVAPCVIFWDEIDVVAKKREGGDFNTPSQLALNVLLAELDGFNPLNGVIFIAATNRLDILDPAILRPGRLDLHIEVGLPAEKDRLELFDLYLKNRPVQITQEDLQYVAQATSGISPAQIENICTEAARKAFYEQSPVTVKHLVECLQK